MIDPNHLAILLPSAGEPGACPWEGGCGLRANSRANVDQLVINSASFGDIMDSIRRNLDSRDGGGHVFYPTEVFEDHFIYRRSSEGNDTYFRQSYAVAADGSIAFADDITEVTREFIPVTNASKTLSKIDPPATGMNEILFLKLLANSASLPDGHEFKVTEAQREEFLAKPEDAQAEFFANCCAACAAAVPPAENEDEDKPEAAATATAAPVIANTGTDTAGAVITMTTGELAQQRETIKAEVLAEIQAANDEAEAAALRVSLKANWSLPATAFDRMDLVSLKEISAVTPATNTGPIHTHANGITVNSGTRKFVASPKSTISKGAA